MRLSAAFHRALCSSGERGGSISTFWPSMLLYRLTATVSSSSSTSESGSPTPARCSSALATRAASASAVTARPSSADSVMLRLRNASSSTLKTVVRYEGKVVEQSLAPSTSLFARSCIGPSMLPALELPADRKSLSMCAWKSYSLIVSVIASADEPTLKPSVSKLRAGMPRLRPEPSSSPLEPRSSEIRRSAWKGWRFIARDTLRCSRLPLVAPSFLPTRKPVFHCDSSVAMSSRPALSQRLSWPSASSTNSPNTNTLGFCSSTLNLTARHARE